MDIEGFGEKLVLRFYEEGLVRSLPDIYDLDRRAPRAAGGLPAQVGREPGRVDRASRGRPFQRVLYALGIPGIGGVNARALAAHFGSIDALMEADAEQIAEVDGIGPVLAGTIVETFAEPRNRELVERAARCRAADGRSERAATVRRSRWRGRPSCSPARSRE